MYFVFHCRADTLQHTYTQTHTHGCLHGMNDLRALIIHIYHSFGRLSARFGEWHRNNYDLARISQIGNTPRIKFSETIL